MLKRPTRGGFTLVELLVVIGIIGLLLGLLLPALKKVQVAARGAKCLANMRNLANNEALVHGAKSWSDDAIGQIAFFPECKEHLVIDL